MIPCEEGKLIGLPRAFVTQRLSSFHAMQWFTQMEDEFFTDEAAARLAEAAPASERAKTKRARSYGDLLATGAKTGAIDAIIIAQFNRCAIIGAKYDK